MLTVRLPARELWDETESVFVNLPAQTLDLEHSLISIAKWESRWCKPFISTTEKTDEEALDYVRHMTITKNVDPDQYRFLPGDVLSQVNDYIKAPMTATWFTETQKTASKSSEEVTNELIYYWMITFNIPSEYQKWHLNRLLTLVRICIIKNGPQKKVPKNQLIAERKRLNDQRRAKLNTKG